MSTPSNPNAPAAPSSAPSSGASAGGPHRRPGPRPGGPGGPGGRFRKPLSRRKVCRFCADKVDYIDFKNVNMLRNFISDRGKIQSSRSTGTCTTHQRGLKMAIRRARNIALLPFTVV